MRVRWLPLALLLWTRTVSGQSLLERSPNLHGTWGLQSGTAAFVFAHRFELIHGGDEVINIPTLTLALGLPLGLAAGLDYTSNSEIVPGALGQNETQYWLSRGISLGSAVRATGVVAYNGEAKSADGALDARAGLGPLAVMGEIRGFSDMFGSGTGGVAGAVGGSLRLTPYLGVTGDVGRVLSRDSFAAVWSAAVVVAIPGTPHTLSLQATNGGATTFQGASHRKELGPQKVRYGFAFTVPLGNGAQWTRIFRRGPPAPPAASAAEGVAARVPIRMIAYSAPEIHIHPGQSVEWVNEDPTVHTVTGDSGDWGSELLSEGGRYVHRFDSPGRYPYHCTPHPQMHGVVVVEGS